MNDQLMLSTVVFFVAIWLMFGFWAIYVWVRDWLRHENAITKMVDKGEVPADYSHVEIEQKILNKRDEVGEIDIDYEDDVRRNALDGVRLKVAHIRDAGFVIGQQDQRDDIPFKDGVRATPFKQGSGEAKQWVRGYCMGRNVIDIKPYYDAA